MSRSQVKIRWWPLVLLLLLAAFVLIWNWVIRDVQRQEKHIWAASIFVVTYLLSLLWILVFSRLRRWIKLVVAGILLGLVAVISVLFRVREVSGDFVPIVEWRWREHTLPKETEPASETEASGSVPFGGPQFWAENLTYPQFLGPRRNAKVTGPNLFRDWEARKPELVWRQSIGAGWSGFAVKGRFAVTQEQRGNSEWVTAYDLLTGKRLWRHTDTARYETFLGGVGPRATPTIAGEHVYTLGATGILNCFDLSTGNRVWTKDIVKNNSSSVPDWGFSGSPLVMPETVIVCAGGSDNRSLVAYDRDSGDFAWGMGSEQAHYSSPLLCTLVGVPQVLIFNALGVASHNPENGNVYWRYPWRRGHPHVAMPVVLPHDRILVSSGYGTGSELLKINQDLEGKFSASRIWKTLRLKAKFTNVVYDEGFIYGLDDGVMVCLDAANGKLRWKRGRYGHGQVILVGNLLLVTSEYGEVVLLEPNPQESRELARFTALEGKSWNPPALAGEYLLVRNHREAACYRLPVMDEEAQ